MSLCPTASGRELIRIAWYACWQVSEAAAEARDNVKFLATLDQSIEPLHTAALPELLDALPALFASLHTLQNASRCVAVTPP